MQRRDFLKMSLGTAAVAGLAPSAFGAEADLPPAIGFDDANRSGGQTPRRVDLIDADWRFTPSHEALLKGVSVTNWVWEPGTPDQEAAMISPTMDTTGGNWKPTTSGSSTLPENSYGWFRTTLPNIAGPGRTLHFEAIDDNGTIYLNGVKLLYHEGWSDAFDVNIDSAWRDNGPNVLVVLVQNIGGDGGITKPVTLGIRPPSANYFAVDFDDSKWQKVHLPHDYIVQGVYTPTADTGHGSLPVYPAWYRRKLDISSSDRGKSVWLYFEGIFRNATIYLNGKQIWFQDDGYDSFHVDISQAANYDGDNQLAIHVDPATFEGWWYEGGGIYRHVWLNVADPLHVVPWGVYVTSAVQDVTGNPSAALTIQTRLTNGRANDQTVTVLTRVFDPDGKQVTQVQSDHTIPMGQELEIQQSANLAAARLWSLEERNLYRAVTNVIQNGKVIDTHLQKFGVRTLRFDPNNGFFMNEKSVKIQGTCNHQDFAGVGVGMPDSILYWRMKQLKEQLGCNGIRCSHNPMAPSMYDACDELGLVVMDETRHPGDLVEAKASVGTPYAHTEHIENMIRRDRNHPSVIMWSMANEEWGIQGDPYGAQMLSALMTAVHKHDTTRPITTAVNAGAGNGWMVGFGSVEDILGVNYNYGDYDYLHKKYPNKMIFGSETASDVECRDNYVDDSVTAHCTSYRSPQGSWEPLGSRAFVAGGFAWTGFDYRGETTPYGWPEVNSNFGLLDMCGFPKDNGLYYRCWWKADEPLVHIFPHWNWPDKVGQKVPIWCFSNCEQVELFVNNVSQGAQPMPKFGHVQWNDVVYQPGKIEARGSNGGQVVFTKVIETTGPPAALVLTADRATLSADAEDTAPVSVSVVDAQGRVVPTADNLVRFKVSGQGQNAGVGNGDPSSHELNQTDTRSAFHGLCMVLVKATDRTGDITLEASADGLTPATLKFHSEKPAK
jgi:beta-galactosidase